MSRKNKDTKVKDPLAALVCAEAFQRLAEQLINKIPFNESIPDVERVGKDVNEGIGEMPSYIADIVVSATNLALALELYVKALLAGLSGFDVPESHDLWDLYQKIPLGIREDLIEDSYNNALRSSTAKVETKLKLALDQLGLSNIDTANFWYFDEKNKILLIPQETLVMIGEINNELMNELRSDLRGSITIAHGPRQSPAPDYNMESNELGEVLKRSRNLFVSWRYMFEFSKPNDNEYQFREFEYSSLVFACEALKETIYLMATRESDR